MTAGVSTACLYPRPVEDSLYDLAVNGIPAAEVFINTHSELRKSFAVGIADTLKRFDMKCTSVHPFTCELEQLMFFSEYERRLEDILEYYKLYFSFMNTVGAEVFVFHGGKGSTSAPVDRFCERFSRLYRLGREFGVTVSLENVSRCQSSSSAFVKRVAAALGDEFAFTLDTKQAVRSGESPFAFLDAVGNKLVNVHASDNSELGDCLPIGKGRFPFRKFLARVKELNPECSVILELYRSGFSGISDLVSGCSILSAMCGCSKEVS